MLPILCGFLAVMVVAMPTLAQTPSPAPDDVPASSDEPSADAATDSEAAAAERERDGMVPGTDEVDDLIGQVTSLMGPVFEQTPWWGWLALLGAIFLGLVAGKVAQSILRRIARTLTERGWAVRGIVFHDAASPASLALLTFGLTIGLQFISLSEPDAAVESQLESLADNILLFLYILAIGWFVYNLVDIVDLGLRRATEHSNNQLAAQIAPLARKTLRIFILVVFVLFVAQNVFGVDITAWLAGLGIAGLAVSLAAQDSIKNLFGSLTVLLDKPFAVGDRIIFGEADGFVEEIGFRSTRIRTFGGHLITVPNMKFTDGTVENVSARPFIRRTLNVTITYDTPPEKIDRAVQIIKDILAAEEFASAFDMNERAPRVYFNDFNAASLNIIVIYWYFLSESAGRDWWTYMEHGERFNRRLFDAFGEEGIDFAFPTQTLYLAGDPDRQLAVRLLKDKVDDAN